MFPGTTPPTSKDALMHKIRERPSTGRRVLLLLDGCELALLRNPRFEAFVKDLQDQAGRGIHLLITSLFPPVGIAHKEVECLPLDAPLACRAEVCEAVTALPQRSSVLAYTAALPSPTADPQTILHLIPHHNHHHTRGTHQRVNAHASSRPPPLPNSHFYSLKTSTGHSVYRRPVHNPWGQHTPIPSSGGADVHQVLPAQSRPERAQPDHRPRVRRLARRRVREGRPLPDAEVQACGAFFTPVCCLPDSSLGCQPFARPNLPWSC